MKDKQCLSQKCKDAFKMEERNKQRKEQRKRRKIRKKREGETNLYI